MCNFPVSSLMRGPTSSMGGMPGQMTRYTFLCMYSCKQEVINDIFLSGLFANIDSQNLELRYIFLSFRASRIKKELRYLSIKVIFFFFQSGWLWDGRQTTHSGFKSDLLKRSSLNQSFKITLTQQEYVRPFYVECFSQANSCCHFATKLTKMNLYHLSSRCPNVERGESCSPRPR